MKKAIAVILTVVFASGGARAGLLINEVSCNSSGDWVELFFSSGKNEKMDISSLYLITGHGSGTRLAAEPVTIYSWDRAETPWDDRFVVVHFLKNEMKNETDLTGDTDHNGSIDLYCANSPEGLWNTDGIVAVGARGDLSCGVIDFMAYSNRDGTLYGAFETLITSAAERGLWQAPGGSALHSTVDIGKNGIEPYMSMARKNSADTNAAVDFAVTKFQTPGRMNYLSGTESRSKLVRPLKTKITVVPKHGSPGRCTLPLRIYNCCNIRLRIFSPSGMMVFESPLFRSVTPGDFSLAWDYTRSGSRIPSGLYLGIIEATSHELREYERRNVFIILSRYK